MRIPSSIIVILEERSVPEPRSPMLGLSPKPSSSVRLTPATVLNVRSGSVYEKRFNSFVVIKCRDPGTSSRPDAPDARPIADTVASGIPCHIAII